jgi:predicted alpha/beta-fold hydrolase
VGVEDRVERVLAKLKLNKFYPFPFARSGFWQTIYGSYWPILKPSRPDSYHNVYLPDGDVLVMAENRPKTWQDGDRIALLIHGLTGSYQSTYMQRMCRRMVKKGYMVQRLNLRFCGPGRGLAKNPYHAGLSEDSRMILHWLKDRYPKSPVTQIGFSLGGNITLKMAGEDGSRPSGNLDSVVAVSPPLDLEAAARRMDERDNMFFARMFMMYAINDIERMQKIFPELKKFDFPKNISVQEFDRFYTAPRNGFVDAKDYYLKSSSINYIPEIKVPTLILSSMDDPVVDGRTVAKLPHRDGLDVLLTEHGGHMGFLGWGTSYDEIRWSDQAVARWLEDTMAI